MLGLPGTRLETEVPHAEELHRSTQVRLSEDYDVTDHWHEAASAQRQSRTCPACARPGTSSTRKQKSVAWLAHHRGATVDATPARADDREPPPALLTTGGARSRLRTPRRRTRRSTSAAPSTGTPAGPRGHPARRGHPAPPPPLAAWPCPASTASRRPRSAACGNAGLWLPASTPSPRRL